MAITVHASTENPVPEGAANDTDITLPGTPAENDIIVVVCGRDSSSAPSAILTSGYTSAFNGASGDASLQIAWKRMSSTPDSVVRIDALNGVGTPTVVYVMRGANTTTAEDAAATSAGVASGVDSPPITTVTDGAWVLSAGCVSDALVETAATAPSSYGNLITEQVNATRDATVVASWREITTAGAEDPGPYGGVGTTNSISVSWALRPFVEAVASLVIPPSPFAHMLVR